MSDRKLWTKQVFISPYLKQDQVISSLISRYGTSHWTTVALEMKRLLENSIRSSKQIRQRWHNHLCPTINKQEWTEQEEEIIFSNHRRFGNKWKDIALLLNNRTDNAVKNHFYSTIRRSLRRVNKYFGYKDSTKKMRNFKPAVLSYLINTSNTNEEYKKIIDIIFSFSQEKPTKNNEPSMNSFIENAKEAYEHILRVINQFSQIHCNIKKQFVKKISKGKMYPTYQHGLVNESQIIQNTSCHFYHSSTLSNRQSLQIEQHQTTQKQQESIEQDQFYNYFGHQKQLNRWFNVNQNDQYIKINDLQGIDEHFQKIQDKNFMKQLDQYEGIEELQI